MSLPWFQFNREKYISDTLSLDTEGHGAYLLLMLDYYSTEAPLLDNDRLLATTVRLPMDRWLELRPILGRFFRIEDGLWHHDYIADVIRHGHVTYNAKMTKTAAATAARVAKANATKNVTSTPREPSRSKVVATLRNGDRVDDVTINVTSNVDPNVTFTQEQEQEQEVVRINLTTSLAGDVSSELASEMQGPAGLGLPLAAWLRTLSPPEPGPELELFRRFVTEKADCFSHDWPAWFSRWREIEIAKAAPKPPRKRTARVEVNARPEPVAATRSMITEDAYQISRTMCEVIGIDEAHPKAYGMPMQVQAWLAAWDPGVILQTVKSVSAGKDFGDNPPNAKYFEAAIARAHADLKRPVPIAKPGESHARATGSSLTAAADRLKARLAAHDDGVALDGGGQGDRVIRLVQES